LLYPQFLAPTALLTAALSIVCATPLQAQVSTLTTGAARLHPSVAPPRIDTPPKVDGRLDDTIWAQAAKLSAFTQERPVEAAPPSESTEVYIAYDSQQIYVGIHAHYTDTSSIRANRADRDQTNRDDTVTVFFDPFLDQQRGYAFTVNAFGVQGDSLLTGGGGGGGGGGNNNRNRGPGGGDPSWDALFLSAGTLVEDGWTAEMVIPFKSLRYPAHGDGSPHRWGFQVQREIQNRNESVVWAPVSRDVIGFLAQMGTIEGMQQLSTSRNLEFLPTVTAVGSQLRDSDTGVLGSSDVEEGGLSVK
jgi:hypothetical protein